MLLLTYIIFQYTKIHILFQYIITLISYPVIKMTENRKVKVLLMIKDETEVEKSRQATKGESVTSWDLGRLIMPSVVKGKDKIKASLL